MFFFSFCTPSYKTNFDSNANNSESLNSKNVCICKRKMMVKVTEKANCIFIRRFGRAASYMIHLFNKNKFYTILFCAYCYMKNWDSNVADFLQYKTM